MRPILVLSNGSTILMSCLDINNYVFQSPTGACVTVSEIIAFVVIFIVGIAVIVLNVMVLYGMRGGVVTSEPSNLLVANFAMCDFITGVVLVYYSFHSLLEWQNVKECELRVGMMVALNLLSGLNVTLLSVDRFLKIKYPLKYLTLVTMRSTLCVCVAIWTMSLVVGLLPVMGWNQENQILSSAICSFFAVLPNPYLITVSSLFVLTFLIIMCIYPRLCRLARRHVAAMATQNHQLRINDHSATRLAKTVTTIMLAYFLCWIPIVVYLVAVLAERTILQKLDMESLVTFAEAAGFINSLINPILYSKKIPAIRSYFRGTCAPCMCGCRCYEDTSVAPSSQGRHTESFRRRNQNGGPLIGWHPPEVFMVMNDVDGDRGYRVGGCATSATPSPAVDVV